MKLGEAQETFARLLYILLKEIDTRGYQCRLGDCFRDPRVHGQHGEDGVDDKGAPYGKSHSNHKLKLAIDINLFHRGQYLTNDEDHRPFGDFWESLHPHCRWGGRYNDGNHYEFCKDAWRT